MQSFLRNIRFGLRMIVKNPTLSLAVISTLVLGIGCTTAIYTVVYATLLKNGITSDIRLPKQKALASARAFQLAAIVRRLAASSSSTSFVRKLPRHLSGPELLYPHSCGRLSHPYR
jgi:hypothetical protein